ncbi:MAG: VOC family protein [Phycisphaerales bacterium JB043]
MTTTTQLSPFHLAFPVTDLDAARDFYSRVLGCGEGRSSARWVDFDFFGHQLVAQLVESHPGDAGVNVVDGHDVPVPHFGVVLTMGRFEGLAQRLREHDAHFIMEPTVRFPGEPGEQATMFVRDPSGNALEFKAFRDLGQLFAG